MGGVHRKGKLLILSFSLCPVAWFVPISQLAFSFGSAFMAYLYVASIMLAFTNGLGLADNLAPSWKPKRPPNPRTCSAAAVALLFMRRGSQISASLLPIT